VVLNLIGGDLDVAQAVTAPRIHHQWYPPWVYYESDGMTSGCRTALVNLGHDLRLREKIGNVQAIWIDPVTGVRTGASDPRGRGTAAGF
jgi:gamma-glutamyltranspeptidase/glutathione hydrolase